MKLDIKKCKYCYGKRYATVFVGIRGAPDFIGDKGFIVEPKVRKVACSSCNSNNKRRIKGIERRIFL